MVFLQPVISAEGDIEDGKAVFHQLGTCLDGKGSIWINYQMILIVPGLEKCTTGLLLRDQSIFILRHRHNVVGSVLDYWT